MNREMLVDGKTLLFLGVRDLDTGRVVANRVRALHDPSPAEVFEAFLDAHAEAPLAEVMVPVDLAKNAPAAFPFEVKAAGNASARAVVLHA
ncbi:MAG TPA: hypothetical protein VNZ52_04135 [Candidatus Thermoplasmatota archaeon]|nr:hypothetical protein [Candidatus Thermoplasmatota archaeon]